MDVSTHARAATSFFSSSLFASYFFYPNRLSLPTLFWACFLFQRIFELSLPNLHEADHLLLFLKLSFLLLFQFVPFFFCFFVDTRPTFSFLVFLPFILFSGAHIATRLSSTRELVVTDAATRLIHGVLNEEAT